MKKRFFPGIMASAISFLHAVLPGDVRFGKEGAR